MKFTSRLYGASVDREEIRALREHTQTDLVKRMGKRHLAIPHIDLVEGMSRAIEKAGHRIGREQFNLRGRGYEKVFGIFDLVPNSFKDSMDEYASGIGRTASIGFRASNDGTVATTLIAGQCVVVCSNGVFSGDSIVLRKRKTIGFQMDKEFDGAINRALDDQMVVDGVIDNMVRRELVGDDAKVMIFDAIMRDMVCAPRHMRHIWNTYSGRAVWDPDEEVMHESHRGAEGALNTLEEFAPEVSPRTVWGLHNAFTRVFRDQMDMSVRLNASARLGRFFGIGASEDAKDRRHALQIN